MSLLRSDNLLPATAMLSAALIFGLLQYWVWGQAGVFEYPLDDVYIHLAMAKNIVHGTYGVNPGEPASAASSILYPLLLTPFPGTEAQRWLPLLWNSAGLLALAWTFGRLLQVAGFTGALGVFVAIVGPLALNMPGVAFTGMEHTLHALAALLGLLGLWRFLNGGGLSRTFVLAIIIAPLLRFEGAAFSLLACGVVAYRGHPRQGALLALAVIVPLVAFMGFLTAIGLDPLPSSVLAKAEASNGLQPFHTFLANMDQLQSQLALLLVAILAVMFLIRPWLRRKPYADVAVVVTLATLAHLYAGHMGWMFRYEHYLFVLLLCGLCLLRPGRGAGLWPAAALGALGLLAIIQPAVFELYGGTTRAVHLQQAQMARFARDYLKAPVAVNDLGWVSWSAGITGTSGAYILDLWGLGSQKARKMRMAEGGAAPGWADVMVRQANVQFAMIYDQTFAGSLGPDWHPIAHLTMDGPTGALAHGDVTFYATNDAAVAPMRRAVRAFAPTLPLGAHLTEVP
jgi:hypothetical protein